MIYKTRLISYFFRSSLLTLDSVTYSAMCAKSSAHFISKLEHNTWTSTSGQTIHNANHRRYTAAAQTERTRKEEGSSVGASVKSLALTVKELFLD
jgi:hypothetical protein